MSGHIPAHLVRQVRERAGDACEYCRVPQASQEATFHVNHIVPRLLGGTTTADNLALACVSCSLRKSARVTAQDPADGKDVPLYHPRKDEWRRHFAMSADYRIEGRSPVGRATIEALGMNRPAIVAIRRELHLLGRLDLR
ncbi:MAG: HNH endonuclease [Planctomycetes bacterium]|nr:HNH endonuclease [Planctomycetota bacterium]